MEKGVKGVYVNGSSGECIYQSVEDKKTVLENVMEEAKGKLTVIAHVACNNTKDSMELARHAESVGADAIAAIPPIYFRLPEHAIAQYWNDISSAAPNTDFVIYNIPQLAGVSLTQSLFAKMRENPRVIGVKNSSMPVQDIQMFKAEGGEGFVVFNGPDEQFISGRAMGADDYLTKPFQMLELAARVETVLRRTKKEETDFTLGSMRCDFHRHQVFLEGTVIECTPKEYELLRVLIRNRNIALSREKLLDMVWGYDFEGGTRTVDVHIQRLRHKLHLEDYIKTVYKLGYRLEVPE